MHKGLHPKTNDDTMYISRNEGGRGLINVEDTVHLAIIGLLKYVGNSEERLLNTARQALGHVEETEKEYKIRRKNERKQIWKDKVLHGQFMKQTEEEGGKKDGYG